jgi:predicted PurR-regulated permease PerM
MLYILFFFLRDGTQLVATLIRVLPLGDVRERQLLASSQRSLWPRSRARSSSMPDYLVLLATLGGLAVFGVSCFVIGPVVAAFFLVVGDVRARACGANRHAW